MSRLGPLLIVLALAWASPMTPTSAQTPTEPATITSACPPDEVPDAGFTDIPEGSRHAAAVNCMVWRDVATGTSATTFSPNSTVTRAQIASFISRLLSEAGTELPGNPPDQFSDDDDSTHEESINALAEAGIVSAAEDDRYEPAGRVTRAEMGDLLLRAYNYHNDPGAGPEQLSQRVPAETQAAVVLTGAGDCSATFRPSLPVPRDQLMSCLAVVLDLLVTQGDEGAVATSPAQEPTTAERDTESGNALLITLAAVALAMVGALTVAALRRRGA